MPGERGQDNLALLIREEVNVIVNTFPLKEDGTEDKQGKQERILDTLEQHMKDLLLSNSTSELTQILMKLIILMGETIKWINPWEI